MPKFFRTLQKTSDGRKEYSPILGGAEEITRSLQGGEVLSFADLRRTWESRSVEIWKQYPQLYSVLGERILKAGEPLLAYDVLSEGAEIEPTSIRTAQLLSLALARSGSTYRANKVAQSLYDQGHRDGETLGVLARTYKDLYRLSKEPAQRRSFLNSAFEIYHLAYKLALTQQEPGARYYNGINAATIALLLNNKEIAQQLALEVRECAVQVIQSARQGEDLYWAVATLGETALILGNWEEAEERYCQADEIGRHRYADLSTTRSQARLLMDFLASDPGRFDHCFSVLNVVVFSGHMLDQPNRPVPRFPAAQEKIVKQEILKRLTALKAGFGYASAACGADILFLESMLELKGEINIVLPFDPEVFVKTSVDLLPGTNWRHRFNALLEQTAQLYVIGQRPASEATTPYEYANLMLDGMAKLRARSLETGMTTLAVWDEKVEGGEGGTAAFIRHRLAQKQPVEAINPLCPEVRRVYTELDDRLAVSDAGGGNSPDAQTQRISSILFADIVGYSRLTEVQIPIFVEYFLGSLAQLLERTEFKPVVRNTWGDAIFLVFETARAAGCFSLQLCGMVKQLDWGKAGLPKDMNLRVGLHAGPAYTCRDPITGLSNFFGYHVSRAARIEPITPPGQVYASQLFAALAMAQEAKEFICEYVGQIPLAKAYGTLPLYHVRHASPGKIAP